MRVTKLIREYVEREVSAKFESKISTITANYRKEQDDMIERLNERVKTTEEECIKMLTDAGFDVPRGNLIGRVGRFSVTKETAEEEVREKREEMRKKKREAIDSILIGLEIGETTKDDLMGLIAAVEV